MNQLKTPYSDFIYGHYCYFTKKGYIRTGNIMNMYWYFFESNKSVRLSEKFKYEFFRPILIEYFDSWFKFMYEVIYNCGIRYKFKVPSFLYGYKYVKAAYPQWTINTRKPEDYGYLFSVISTLAKNMNNYNSGTFEKICRLLKINLFMKNKFFKL